MPVSVPFTGGCACGAIRYECSAAPLLSWKCHCRTCQQATGSAFNVNVIVPARRLIQDYGEAAGLALPAHPHMLRHACGFALADQGADTRLIQDYLGYRNIPHTNGFCGWKSQVLENQ